MRIGRIHHVWRIIVDEVEPVLLMAIVDHGLRVVVAVDRIEPTHVQELLIEQEHRLMRVALERNERAAAHAVLVAKLHDTRIFELLVRVVRGELEDRLFCGS